MKRHARIALLLTILLPLPYSLGQEDSPPPAPAPKQDEPKQDEPKQDEPKQDAPSGEPLRAVSDVPDSAWDAPLPMFTDPQTVAVYYLASVLADKQEHAAALTSSTNRRYGTQEFIAKLRADVEVASLRIEMVAVMNNQACVVSGPAKVKKEDPKLGDDPRVILALRANREPDRQHWLITHVYIVSAANAKKEVERLNSQVNLSKAPYRIKIGDQLCFGSQGDPMWDRTFTVQPDGTITLERLGRVWASGLTARELHDRLAEAHGNYFEVRATWPPITVMPAKVNTGDATTAEDVSAAASANPRMASNATAPRYAPPPIGFSSGPTPDELSTLRETYERLETYTERLAGKYRQTPLTPGSKDAETIKETLKSLVAKAFKARQQLQRGELAAFRRRLDVIESQIGEREQRKNEIIQRRVNELLDPNLKWDPVDVGEAGDAAKTTSANKQMPPTLRTEEPLEIDTYFSPTYDSPTRTDVATAGESVWLILEVRSPKKQRLTGLSISIDLDDAFKPQQVSRAYQREGNLFTWQNQSVKADATGRYVVNCLCVAPTENARCWVTVNDAAGQCEMRRAILRIATAETTQDVPAPPAEDHTSSLDRRAVLKELVGEAGAKQAMLLFFNADWCKPCQKAWPKVRELQEEGIPIFDVNLDKKRETANAFGVQQIPTLMFCKNGEEVDRIAGPSVQAFVEKHRPELQAEDQPVDE